MLDKLSTVFNHFINTPLWAWHRSKQSDLIGWWGDKESIYKAFQCCFLSVWGVCWQLGSHTQLKTLLEARTAKSPSLTEERSKVRGRYVTRSHNKHHRLMKCHASFLTSTKHFHPKAHSAAEHVVMMLFLYFYHCSFVFLYVCPSWSICHLFISAAFVRDSETGQK